MIPKMIVLTEDMLSIFYEIYKIQNQEEDNKGEGNKEDLKKPEKLLGKITSSMIQQKTGINEDKIGILLSVLRSQGVVDDKNHISIEDFGEYCFYGPEIDKNEEAQDKLNYIYDTESKKQQTGQDVMRTFFVINYCDLVVLYVIYTMLIESQNNDITELDIYVLSKRIEELTGLLKPVSHASVLLALCRLYDKGLIDKNACFKSGHLKYVDMYVRTQDHDRGKEKRDNERYAGITDIKYKQELFETIKKELEVKGAVFEQPGDIRWGNEQVEHPIKPDLIVPVFDPTKTRKELMRFVQGEKGIKEIIGERNAKEIWLWPDSYNDSSCPNIRRVFINGRKVIWSSDTDRVSTIKKLACNIIIGMAKDERSYTQDHPYIFAIEGPDWPTGYGIDTQNENEQYIQFTNKIGKWVGLSGETSKPKTKCPEDLLWDIYNDPESIDKDAKSIKDICKEYVESADMIEAVFVMLWGLYWRYYKKVIKRKERNDKNYT